VRTLILRLRGSLLGLAHLVAMEVLCWWLDALAARDPWGWLFTDPGRSPAEWARSGTTLLCVLAHGLVHGEHK
jgi:hypothetical protein